MQVMAKPGQQIKYRHQGDQDVVVLDQQILRNVLINLLSNAMKYSPEGKSIHFATALNKDQLILTIQDAGIGIPEAEQRHLFQRFFRAENVTGIPGTGLGLNIVRRYLELLGGTIDFVSQENQGTTFTVKIP